MSRVLKVVIALLVLTIVAVGSFGIGAMYASSIGWDIPGVSKVDVSSTLGEQVEEVEQLLQTESLNPSDEDSMTAGAISGLLESLDDPYAIYFDPRHFEYFNDQTDGEFFGIGVTIAEREGTVYVVSVIEETPADSVGLKAEDEIVRIDDVTREKWDLDEVVRRIRGPEGTIVEVEVYRPEAEGNEVFEITRAKVEIPNIMTRMEGDDVGYIRLMSFNNHAAQSIRDAVIDLEEQGATSFVLDLRNNPGGLLNVSVDVASVFVDDGVIVRVENGEGETVEEHRARGNAETDAPVVLLINRNSASASEIVAGALQDYERAVILGETSFGKGSVQTVERLSFGGAVKFTIAHYVTPKGTVIDGVGVIPDIEVEMDPADQAEDEDDIQLKRAVEEAHGLL